MLTLFRFEKTFPGGKPKFTPPFAGTTLLFALLPYFREQTPLHLQLEVSAVTEELAFFERKKRF